MKNKPPKQKKKMSYDEFQAHIGLIRNRKQRRIAKVTKTNQKIIIKNLILKKEDYNAI